MNPARTLGPAIFHSKYRAIVVYFVSTIFGAVAGAWVFNILRYTDKPLHEITKGSSILK